MKRKLSQDDYEFINSLNAAIAEQTPKKMRWVIYFWFITTLLFILWASLTQIDEITRGVGEVVPSGENQLVQNLEGGIVQEIMVKVGDNVKKDQPLLKIENLKSSAQLDSANIKELELDAKITRLKAEAEGLNFGVDSTLLQKIPLFVENERSLYSSRQKEFNAKIEALTEQKKQKEQELKEAQEKIVHLEHSTSLINEEVGMMRPMVAQGVKSKVAFMKLQREQSNLAEELSTTKLSLPRIKSSINEAANKVTEANNEFKNQAKKELNEVTAEAMRVKESSEVFSDEMNRTLVRSPSNGIVQRLFVYTVGGVIKSGDNLIEIVPTDDILWLEVKIKPSDIAFIYPGQKTIVKFSAYDYAIYGSLDGVVEHISADTSKDEKENTFYTLHIKTSKNYLGTQEKPLKIIPGMTVDVNIITGKKSVMDYILKPILKAKQYMFTER